VVLQMEVPGSTVLLDHVGLIFSMFQLPSLTNGIAQWLALGHKTPCTPMRKQVAKMH